MLNTLILGSFTQVIWRSTKKIGIGMARSDNEGRIAVVARYHPKGNIPGEVKDNVRPLVTINPFDLPTFSKTREEANLNVQTALVAPEICEGVARDYAKPIKDIRKSRSNSLIRYSKMNGVLHNANKNKKTTITTTAQNLCPNGRLIPLCCGAPSIAEVANSQDTPPTPGLGRNPTRQSFRVLAPSKLDQEHGHLWERRNPFFNEPESTTVHTQQIKLHNLSQRGQRNQTSRSRTVSVQPLASDSIDGRNTSVVRS